MIRRVLGLDRACAVDLERDQSRESGIADVPDRRMVAEPFRQGRRALACGDASASSSVSSPRSSEAAASGDAVIPERPRMSLSRAVVSGSRVTVAPSNASWRPVRYFVAEWIDDVGAFLERAEVDRRRRGCVADDQAAMRAERVPVREREQRVRRCLDPDDVGVRGRSRSGRTRRNAGPSARDCGRGRRCRSTPPRPARSSRPAPQRRATPLSRHPFRMRRGARRRLPALQAAPRRPRRLDGRSARRRTHAARRPRRTARSSSGRPNPSAESS